MIRFTFAAAVALVMLAAPAYAQETNKTTGPAAGNAAKPEAAAGKDSSSGGEMKKGDSGAAAGAEGKSGGEAGASEKK